MEAWRHGGMEAVSLVDNGWNNKTEAKYLCYFGMVVSILPLSARTEKTLEQSFSIEAFYT
jgi:hypothetical protein